MSVDLDRQLKEYCRLMDEKQGALSFEDILERSGELPLISGRTSPQLSPRRRWIAAAAVALAVLVLAIGTRLLQPVDVTPQPADQPTPTSVPTSTTVAPDVETMSDFEIIQAGVAALYSGDAERAAELFELPDRDDDAIRGEAAYQAAIGGRLTLQCTESMPGTFSCPMSYQNAITNAIGHVDLGEASRVVVEGGVITEFAFRDHIWMAVEMGIFLASEARFEGYADCGFPPFPESCATIQLENLDAWEQWRESVEPANVVEVALESWYGGDCQAAQFIAGPFLGLEGFITPYIDCSTSSLWGQTIEHESILGAQVSVEDCEWTSATATSANLSCGVHYSNAMNTAVGKPPSVTSREFMFLSAGWVREPISEQPWYEGDYPEDTDLRESFRLFAEAGELHDEYAAAGCASARTPECGNLILDNLDNWATWYETNS